MPSRKRFSGARSRAFGGGSKNKSRLRRKGQTSGVVQYSIKNSRGNSKYIGTTNNPRRRAAEHIKSGKMKKGDRLVVETGAVSRKQAESVEAGKLRAHRKRYGRNPKHNTTNDGKFHHRQATP